MKRSREDVIEGILKLCQEPASVTKIVYQVNLNFRTVKPYIKKLLASELIIEIPDNHTNLYKTTPKGMEALAHIKALMDLLKPIIQEPLSDL